MWTILKNSSHINWLHFRLRQSLTLPPSPELSSVLQWPAHLSLDDSLTFFFSFFFFVAFFLRAPAFTQNMNRAVRQVDWPHQAYLEIQRCRTVIIFHPFKDSLPLLSGTGVVTLIGSGCRWGPACPVGPALALPPGYFPSLPRWPGEQCGPVQLQNPGIAWIWVPIATIWRYKWIYLLQYRAAVPVALWMALSQHHMLCRKILNGPCEKQWKKFIDTLSKNPQLSVFLTNLFCQQNEVIDSFHWLFN